MIDNCSGQAVTILEGKTGKENILMVNRTVHKAIKDYLDKVRPGIEDYLFASQKGRGSLTIQAVNAMVKRWTKAVDLKGNFGAHTLRKTLPNATTMQTRRQPCVNYSSPRLKQRSV